MMHKTDVLSQPHTQLETPALLTPQTVLLLESRLNVAGSNLKEIFCDFLRCHFPDFAVTMDTLINKDGAKINVDILVSGQADQKENALAIIVLEELDKANLQEVYSRLALLKSEKETLRLQTIILARSSSETLEGIGVELINQNKLYPSSLWLDIVVILNDGFIAYGGQPLTNQTLGNFLFHTATPPEMAIPPLYLKLIALPSKTPLMACMYRIALNLLVAWPSERHGEANSLNIEGEHALPLIDYQYDLQGELKPMPENQYLDRKAPTFPIEIILPDNKVAGTIEHLEWQDGGVLVLKDGMLPLDFFLAFGQFKGPRAITIQRDKDLQFSSVLPLNKRDFEQFINTLRLRGNLRFHRAEPHYVIQTISNEGLSVPIIARLHMGLLELARKAPEQSLSADEYHRTLELIYSNIMSARKSLKEIKETYLNHLAGLKDGSTGRVEGNVIRILQPIDTLLRDATEKFINNCNRALKTGMQNLVKGLGYDIGFFYQKESQFQTAIKNLAAHEPELAEYLKKCRDEWSQLLIKLRNDHLEHGDSLITSISHTLVNRKIEASEPQMAGRGLIEITDFFFDKLSKFIEEITVYYLQEKLIPGFIFREIPLKDRQETCPNRFQLTVATAKWKIAYTSTSFDQT